jgi:hypothetical protein
MSTDVEDFRAQLCHRSMLIRLCLPGSGERFGDERMELVRNDDLSPSLSRFPDSCDGLRRRMRFLGDDDRIAYACGCWAKRLAFHRPPRMEPPPVGRIRQGYGVLNALLA